MAKGTLSLAKLLAVFVADTNEMEPRLAKSKRRRRRR